MLCARAHRTDGVRRPSTEYLRECAVGVGRILGCTMRCFGSNKGRKRRFRVWNRSIGPSRSGRRGGVEKSEQRETTRKQKKRWIPPPAIPSFRRIAASAFGFFPCRFDADLLGTLSVLGLACQKSFVRVSLKSHRRGAGRIWPSSHFTSSFPTHGLCGCLCCSWPQWAAQTT